MLGELERLQKRELEERIALLENLNALIGPLLPLVAHIAKEYESQLAKGLDSGKTKVFNRSGR